AQLLTEGGDGQGPAGALRGLGRDPAGGGVRHYPLHQPRVALAGQLVAHLDEADLARRIAAADADRIVRPVGVIAPLGNLAGAADRGDLVQGRHRGPRADLAGVDAVVGEILLVQHAGLIADQAVFTDAGRVELDLDLDVVGDGEGAPV